MLALKSWIYSRYKKSSMPRLDEVLPLFPRDDSIGQGLKIFLSSSYLVQWVSPSSLEASIFPLRLLLLPPPPSFQPIRHWSRSHFFLSYPFSTHSIVILHKTNFSTNELLIKVIILYICINLRLRCPRLTFHVHLHKTYLDTATSTASI